MVDPIALEDLQRYRYADVEAFLVTWVNGALGPTLDLACSTEQPLGDGLAALLDGHRFYVQIEAFGGAEIDPARDGVNVDVDVYGPPDESGNADRAGASDIAELIRSAFLFHLPGYDDGHATVSAAKTISRPTARPYDDNTNTRRFSAAYQVVLKSHD